MVQLPNPPVNSRLATSNGLPASTEGNNGSSNNGNAVGDRRQEQQQPQEEANKATTSSTATGSEDPPQQFTSSLEITAAPSSGSSGGSVRNADSDADPVTLVSTPAVSIFQVAHRTAGNSGGAVLQPVTAVTGFNPPNPRVKNPAAASSTTRSKGSRGSSTATAVRPCLDDLPPTIILSQLLAQSPSIDSSTETQPGAAAASNGPNQSAGTTTPVATNKQTSQSATTRGSLRGQQRSRGEPSIPPPNDGPMVSSTVPGSSPLPATDISSPCRVPLVKYVDLDMVSSPSRPRPGSTTGVRRHSQGSNSNSPDPHRSNTANKRTAGQNPSSPAVNSPQSPALQAPPSPLSFRKQHHHVYRPQESKVGDRLASPSHPSQCSSPFSRPSSRSQVNIWSLNCCNRFLIDVFCVSRMQVQAHRKCLADPCSHQDSPVTVLRTPDPIRTIPERVLLLELPPVACPISAVERLLVSRIRFNRLFQSSARLLAKRVISTPFPSWGP